MWCKKWIIWPCNHLIQFPSMMAWEKKLIFFYLNGPHLNYHSSCLCGYLFDLIIFSITFLFFSLNLFFPFLYFCHQFFFKVIKPLRPFSIQLDFSQCDHTSFFDLFCNFANVGDGFLSPIKRYKYNLLINGHLHNWNLGFFSPYISNFRVHLGVGFKLPKQMPMFLYLFCDSIHVRWLLVFIMEEWSISHLHSTFCGWDLGLS